MDTMTVAPARAPRAGADPAAPTFVACREWIDDDGSPCGLPVQIARIYQLGSTDGQVDHVQTRRCAAGHWLNCASESLA